MCFRCCFNEIIASLGVKISNNPLLHAFGKTTFIELHVYEEPAMFKPLSYSLIYVSNTSAFVITQASNEKTYEQAVQM